jgi:hypothetical protein
LKRRQQRASKSQRPSGRACDRAAAGGLAGAAQVARDVDPQAPAGEDRSSAIEQRRRQTGVAAGQGGESPGVLLELVPGGESVALLTARVAAGQQARQVAVAPGRLDQQQQGVVGLLRRGPARGGRAAGDADLGADDGAQSRGNGGLVEARNPVEAVAIAERQGVVAELCGALDQVFGVRCRLEEREGAAAAQLDVVRLAARRRCARDSAGLVGEDHGLTFVFYSSSVNLGEFSPFELT